MAKLAFSKLGLKNNNQVINIIYNEQTIQQTNGMLYDTERQLLEQWTHKRFSRVLFDSTIHRWSINNSEFNQRILNHRNLIFLIRDIPGNLFGCYISSIILPRVHIDMNPRN